MFPNVGDRRYHVVAEPVGESDRIGVVHRRHDVDQVEAKPGVSLCAREEFVSASGSMIIITVFWI